MRGRTFTVAVGSSRGGIDRVRRLDARLRLVAPDAVGSGRERDALDAAAEGADDERHGLTGDLRRDRAREHDLTAEDQARPSTR
jgi:hypothetical protein